MTLRVGQRVEASSASSIGLSTAVLAQSHDQEVMGTNSTGCWAFSLPFLSLFLKSVSLKRDLKEVEMFLILTFKMLSCAAWGEASLMCPRISQKASSVNAPIQALLKWTLRLFLTDPLILI